MVWDSIISAGSSLIGGIMANNASNKQATRQMAFQERMARNAHQYEVEDLRAAGLNPILSAKYGGAHVPPGASAPVQDVIGPAVNSAQAARRLSQELENMDAQNEKTHSDTDLNKALEQKAVEDARLSSASAKNVAVNNRILNAEASKAEVEKAVYDAIIPTVNSAKESLKAVQTGNPGGFFDGLKNFGKKLYPPDSYGNYHPIRR